jgi:hypothetical protein
MQLVLDDQSAEGVGAKRNMPPLWAATRDIVLSAGRLSTIVVRAVRAFRYLAAQQKLALGHAWPPDLFLTPPVAFVPRRS